MIQLKTLTELVCFFDEINNNLKFIVYVKNDLIKQFLKGEKPILLSNKRNIRLFKLERYPINDPSYTLIGEYSQTQLHGRIHQHPERTKIGAWGDTEVISDSVILFNIFETDLRNKIHDIYCPICEKLTKEIQQYELSLFLDLHVNKHIKNVLKKHLVLK